MSDPAESDTSWWSQITNQICESQQTSISKQQLLILFDKLLALKIPILNSKTTQFYSNLIFVTASILIKSLRDNLLTLDEINQSESLIELFVKYTITKRNDDCREDQDECLNAITLNQCLLLIESLLTLEDHIGQSQLNEIIKNLKNSKQTHVEVEVVDSSHLSTTASMNSIIKSFFSFEFKSEQFSRICLKYLDQLNCFDLILIELEKSLIYLNVYRKNHLKQFDQETNPKLMSCEEALQARANLPYLLNDMTLLDTYLRIIQESLRLDKSIEYNRNNRLSDLVQAAQISMLQTVLAELILIENNNKITNRQIEDAQTTSNDDILNLIKITGEIIEKIEFTDEIRRKNLQIIKYYSEILINYQDELLSKLKQDSSQSEQTNLSKNLTSTQFNLDLNSYIHKNYLNSLKTTHSIIEFEYLFKLTRHTFHKILLFNDQSKLSNHTKCEPLNEAFNLNKIKNIDDPSTDDDNYDADNFHDDDDSDTIATTVTTYTNITSANNVNEDELLIGSWLYEQINSNGTPLQEEVVINETTKANSNTNEANLSNSTQILDTTFDLDTKNNSIQNYVDLVVDILNLVQQVAHKNSQNLKQSLNHEQIKLICQIIIDIESTKQPLSNILICTVYNFFKFLLINGFIDKDEQDQCISQLGLSDLINGTNEKSTTLLINNRYLSLLSQIFIVRFNKSDSSAVENCLQIWLNFLNTISNKIVTCHNEDLSLEYSSFLLFLFHNLSCEHREKILLEVMASIIKIDTELTDRHTTTPLLISRLLFLLQYLLTHFDQPSRRLIKTIDSKLLHLHSDEKCDIFENECQKFLNLIKPNNHEVLFYNTIDSNSISDTPEFVYKSQDYAKLYQSLLNLKNIGSQLKYTEQNNLVDFVSITYSYNIIENLTDPNRGLKLPDNYLTQIEDLTDDQMYQFLKLNENKKICNIDVKPNTFVNLFVNFWSKEDCKEINLSLLDLNLDLLIKNRSNLDADLTRMEQILTSLFKKLSQFYKIDLFLNKFEQKENQIELELLSSVINLIKWSDKAIDHEQNLFVTLDDDEKFRNFDKYLKNFNQNVGKKFDLVKNVQLLNLNWYCQEVNVIRVLAKIASFCLDLKSNNFDEIFLEIYSNLNLYGSLLIDSLNKYSNISKKFTCLTNKLVFNFLTKYFSEENQCKFDEKIFVNLLKQLENSLEQLNGLQGFLEFYDSKENLLLTLLKTSSSAKSTKSYLIQLISLFNRLFRLSFTSANKLLGQVLSQINVISTSQDQESLQKWLAKIVQNQDFNLNDKFILQQFVIYLTSEAQINESVCLTVLNNLIQMSNSLITENSNSSFLPGLLCLMDTLSSSGSGLGHLYLFKACIIWIEFYSTTSLNDSIPTQKSICYILSYLTSILNYLKPRNSSDNSELSKYYQDNLLIDFDKQIFKLFDLIEKKPESIIDDQEDGTQNNDCDLLETEIYENNPTIDDTCNDQDLDDNYDLNRDENSEDDENDFDDEDDDDDDDDDEDNNNNNNNDDDEIDEENFIEQSSEPSQPAQPVGQAQSGNLEINDIFGAYGVNYQIFDESGDVLRNENRLDDVMDEEDDEDDAEEEDGDDDDDVDDEEYGDDFTDNFVEYDIPTNQTDTNRNIYQDLISTISAAAAAFNGRINTQTSSNNNTQLPKKADEQDLNSKLCTYTVTKKEFMNQHWYYCHTCKMVDRIGMCTICAKVCHAEHDVSYAKFGSFFCDCGAKEDNSCKALQKRTEKKLVKQRSKRTKLSSSSSQPPVKDSTIDLLKKLMTQIKVQKSSKIDKLKQQILESITSKNLSKLIQDLLTRILVPKSLIIYENSFLNSNSSLARTELTRLHTNLTSLSSDLDQLFQVTLGSQEGAFENVRLTYTGENGSLIKQLIQNHSVRRASMCLVTSKKRQNLIVTHEKGKSSHLTILQLNALLKQDSNKRNKLTLTKLNTIPVPFTLLTVTANPANEDYVSLTGLKDCYVMYLNENGQQNESDNKTNLIVLHPSLETSNYIIKSQWLPGSKTQLALVTSEFIKIYDLSLDKISPIYYFVLPMGKIKDLTFFYGKTGQKYIVTITSDGYLYYEELNEVTSAKNGIYYVTNTIDLKDPTPNGVSIYFSFKLNLLFWSHQNGKTFTARIKMDKNQLELSATSQLNLSKLNLNQALCNWSEIQGHAGLVLAMSQLSNNPIVLMFKPDKIMYQEIKMVNNNGAPSKAKIQDMVAIRHAEDDLIDEEDLSGLPSIQKEKTTMIILCDDGSLKIYVADSNKTDYWLAPDMRPTQPILQLKSQWTSACLYQLSPNVVKEIYTNTFIKDTRDRLKSSSTNNLIKKQPAKSKLKTKSTLFPIDYFEKCVHIKDIEFSGKDLLEIYNSQQLKTRLSDTNSTKYVSVKKPNSFKIEITNVAEANRLLLMGCRIMCGINSIEKSPCYLEIFGRRINVKLNRSRWYDVCLSRDEAFIADNKLVITIGSSSDPSGLTFIDAIYCYGKSKNELNWTKNEAGELQKKYLEKDKKDESKSIALPKKQLDPKKSFFKLLSLMEPKPFDYLLSQTIDLYEVSCDLSQFESEQMTQVSLNLLSLILPPIVLYKSKSLLLNSVKSQSLFDSLKIDSILQIVQETLKNEHFDLVDCEIFEKCLLCLKSSLKLDLNRVSNKIDFKNVFDLLNQIFWNLIDLKSNDVSMNHEIGEHTFSNLSLTIESLVEIQHFFILNETTQGLDSIVLESYLKLLTSDSLHVNFTTRKMLLNLLKPGVKKSKTEDNDEIQNLVKLRKTILYKLTENIPRLLELNPHLDGLKSIALFQVILSLLADLSPKEESDKHVLDLLINNLLNLMEPLDETDSSLIEKNSWNEIRLVGLRTLSILLSKSKYQRSGTETCNFIIQNLVSHLIRFNLVDKCLSLLKHFLKTHWSIKTSNVEETGLIRVSSESVYYDELSPYFVKTDPLNKDSFIIPPPNLVLLSENSNPETNNSIKLFDNYIELFTEILIRLPYQMKKLCLGSNPNDVLNQIGSQFNFSQWIHYLCEYLMFSQCNYLKRLIKKLLQILCGSKEKYRKFKDQHILSTCMNQLVSICPLSVNPKPTSMLTMGASMSEALESMNRVQTHETALAQKISKLSYLNLIKIFDNLKLVLEVSSSRSPNWQKFCLQNPATILYLIEMSLLMGIDSNGSGSDSSNLNSNSSTSLASTSVIIPTILQLLQSLFGQKSNNKTEMDENISQLLVSVFFKQITREILIKFIREFLLEAFQSQIRWSMHALIFNLFKNSNTCNQLVLYESLMSLWSEVMCVYGTKSSQYCDLIGYFVLKLSNESIHNDYIGKLIIQFKIQNSNLKNHANSLIYENIPDLDGYYLEADPCFICNNLDQAIQSFKLNSLKVDSRFTTNQQIYKLTSIYSLQKILFKITDIRKTKMIQTVNVYFTNRTSHSIVDLKMNLKLWSKAKQIRIEPGQSEIKIDLQLPIVCSNLMFEYADFYDRDTERTSESAILQCPRCSASVTAVPGVCTTCGENVFQCHKCRAINYDERDPFLCNSCGFCKFAKFDINLIGRQFITIDPIESEDDRKTTIQNMNGLLDRADKIYTQISQEFKPVLEALIIKQDEQNIIDKFIPTNQPAPPLAPAQPTQTTSTSLQPNNPPGIIGIRMAPLTVLKPKNTQTIAQKYTECKTKFDELSKIILKLNLSRKELREYDKQFKSSVTILHRKNSIISLSKIENVPQKCYGCAAASLEHCFNAFRVLLCSNNTQLINNVKNELCSNDILEEILNFNLKRNLAISQPSTQPLPPPPPPTSTTTTTTTTTAPTTTTSTNPPASTTQQIQSIQTSVSTQKLIDRDLINILYLVLKDNFEASIRFEKLVLVKLDLILHNSSVMPSNNLKYELIILSSLIQKLDDSCWLMRFKLVINILLKSLQILNSKFLDELILPCLRIISHLVKSSTTNLNTNNNNGKKSDLTKLMDFNVLLSPLGSEKLSEDSILRFKFFTKWKNRKFDILNESKWLKICLFCSTNRSIRQLTSNIIQNLFNLCQTLDNNERKFLLVDLIGENMSQICQNDESHLEYLSVFKQILNSNDKESKYRLVIKHKILAQLEMSLQHEIKNLGDLERLTTDYNSQSISLSFNLNRGLCIKSLSELLSLFLKDINIRTKFKSRLIATVLNSYLSLKKLLFQRTKLIDEAQEKLLNILELLTSGTEQESRHFMSICIETINNFDLDDLVTPVFIFERLSNIIYPEEVVDNKEFLMILEKDPNQEDYLQGRMLGNPYSSNDPGLGPLMRNVKNKICTDSELIALLEDDNGMELLVHNKIITLDLNVRDVYKKVWLSECISEHEPMRIVYRMTGLSGDATEDIIDNLDPKNTDVTKNEEEVYRMAEELAHNGALPVMLERLSSINQQNFTMGKPLLRVLLKLFDYALKLKLNRSVLIKPQLKTISTMLQTLNMMLVIQVDVSLTEKLISIMQVILSEASKQPQDVYNEFSSLCGDREQLEFLLNNIKSNYVRGYSNLMQALMGLIPFLSFGDETKMKSLIEYFTTFISNFDEIDKTTTSNEDILHLECFCVIVNGIEIGENGTRLRDMMSSSGIVQKSIEYLLQNSPQITTYLNSDYDLWKDFIDRKSLPYVLRILTGLCKSHEVISDLIGESCIPVLHKLEQFSSGNLVGVLAEDLLVALKESPSKKVSTSIEEVRTQTKNEKKKLAMAMRKKQLSQLGMRTNDKGQLLLNTDNLKNLQVEEEKGHVCCICREGYKYHPQKVLAIYTFSKKCDLETYESKSRKTIGFTTVTHFNLVHIDCHTNAIRSSRTCRDEWENAALQNANTKCNGILPIWGPEVIETSFSNALARHNNYLLEATGIRDVNYVLYVYDLKLLLNRFAENLSFSEDTGGGGRESNINLIAYIIHAILYSINTAKYVQREERNLNNFLEQTEKLIQNSFECDNVFYYLSLALCIVKPSDWKANRLKFLKRVLLTCHSRLVNTPTGDKLKLTSTTLQEFKKYKPSLLFMGLVNLFYKHILSKVSLDAQMIWTEQLANYVRHNDVSLMDSCKKILKEFEEDLLICEDWLEMFDVLGFMQEFDISDPVEFLTTYLQSINN